MTRLAVLSACALAASALLPAAADARHNREMYAASDADQRSPDLWTVTHRPKLFFDMRPTMQLWFRVAHEQPVNATIKLVKPSSGVVLRRWRRTNIADDQLQRVQWNGLLKSRLQKMRRYGFRVIARDSAGNVTRSAGPNDELRDSFRFWHHRFPVRGRHQYGDGMGAGRGHQGQDVFARCGTLLQAARGGRVQYRGYHSAAGHYIVIDGRKTGIDYAYLHLKRRARAAEGERVKTGETIGRVGDSGNASGCHLHFEMWSRPGWYEGGSPMDPTPHLKRWDRHS